MPVRNTSDQMAPSVQTLPDKPSLSRLPPDARRVVSWTVVEQCGALSWLRPCACSFMCHFWKRQQCAFCTAVTSVSCCVFNNVHRLWARFHLPDIAILPRPQQTLYQKVNSRWEVLSEDQIMTSTGLVRCRRCKVGFHPSAGGQSRLESCWTWSCKMCPSLPRSCVSAVSRVQYSSHFYESFMSLPALSKLKLLRKLKFPRGVTAFAEQPLGCLRSCRHSGRRSLTHLSFSSQVPG